MTKIDIPTSMRAVRCHGPGDYRLETRPVPAPGPGEVLARILLAGICASDLKCYLGGSMFWGTEDSPGGYCQPPVIAGHEFIAEVATLGERSGAKYGLAVGDRVISEQIVPCYACHYCTKGAYWMCETNDVYGFRRNTPGCWAQYMLFPANAINHKVPETLPVDHAAFIEPLACAIHAVNRAAISFNDSVAIAGCGPLGLGMVAAAKMKGPARIVALDMHDARLDMAREAGADIGLNPGRCDAVAEMRGLTDGYGCDVYIEATGHPSGVTQGLEMIRKMGRFVAFSVFSQPTTADWTLIGDRKELTIHGAHLSPHCYPPAIRILEAGKLPMDRILTHQLPLAEFQHGLDLVKDGAGSVKVLLVP